MIHTGDCVTVMAGMAPDSVDAIVTDPPYGLEFMGRSWDRFDGEPIDPAFLHWFAGFVDGEGCFSIHRKPQNTYDCQFSISLRADDRPILERIQATLGMGTLSTTTAHRKNQAARWSVSSKVACLRLRDIFRAFPLRAKKARDFEVWSEALDEWVDHQVGEWDGMADARARLKAMREYVPEGVRVDPFQMWSWRWAREALRVLKPGGHLLAMGGTRTYHRMAAGLEDAGFEIRDTLVYAYASGFPKSLDVSKAIDKAVGAERPIVRERNWHDPMDTPFRTHYGGDGPDGQPVVNVTAPATDAAKRWQGWGTALKPAWEPIVLARKPLQGTVAGNVERYGTGALNIQATRIGVGEESPRMAPTSPGASRSNDGGSRGHKGPSLEGDLPNRSPSTDLAAWSASQPDPDSARLASVLGRALTHPPVLGSQGDYLPCRGCDDGRARIAEAVALASPPSRRGVHAVHLDPEWSASRIRECRCAAHRATWDELARLVEEEGVLASDTIVSNVEGRWPSNLLLTDAELFDVRNDGVVGSGAVRVGFAGFPEGKSYTRAPDNAAPLAPQATGNPPGYGDTGGYARFFKIKEGDGCYLCGRANPADGTSSPPRPSGDSVPSPARTEASRDTDTGTDSRATSATEQISWHDAGGSMPNTPRSRRRATSPASAPQSGRAKSRGAASPEIDTTTTTASRWLCAICADLITSSTTSEPDYPRILIVPKASRSDREPVWGEGLDEGMVGGRSRADGRQWDIPGSTLDNGKRKRKNSHPTVKPVDLMRHLVRLVTPPGGTVLDPFLGSGTTAIAAIMEGFTCVGIELDPEYVRIAEARLNGVQAGMGL